VIVEDVPLRNVADITGSYGPIESTVFEGERFHNPRSGGGKCVIYQDAAGSDSCSGIGPKGGTSYEDLSRKICVRRGGGPFNLQGGITRRSTDTRIGDVRVPNEILEHHVATYEVPGETVLGRDEPAVHTGRRESSTAAITDNNTLGPPYTHPPTVVEVEVFNQYVTDNRASEHTKHASNAYSVVYTVLDAEIS